MSDTQKTTAALLAQLDSNGIGGISGADLRDAVVSILGGRGSVYLNGGSTPQSCSRNVWNAVALATEGPASGVTLDAATGKITVAIAAVYEFSGYLVGSYDAATDHRIGVLVNGEAVRWASAKDIDAGAEFGRHVSGQVTLAADDYVQIAHYPIDENGVLTPVSAGLAVKRIG
jgi:hypothetical protein